MLSTLLYAGWADEEDQQGLEAGQLSRHCQHSHQLWSRQPGQQPLRSVCQAVTAISADCHYMTSAFMCYKSALLLALPAIAASINTCLCLQNFALKLAILAAVDSLFVHWLAGGLASIAFTSSSGARSRHANLLMETNMAFEDGSEGGRTKRSHGGFFAFSQVTP